MGWTSYNAPTFYDAKKRRDVINRKEECDKLYNWKDDKGKCEVLKSSMVGCVYYAAVERITFATETEPEKRKVWAGICLTKTDIKNYYNFYYKDMDETCGPCECKCPKGILDLLTSTDSEYALNWRERCRENLKNKSNPNSLRKLPVGTYIKFIAPAGLQNYKEGDEVTVWKARKFSSNGTYWIDGQYYYPAKTIGENFIIIKKGE